MDSRGGSYALTPAKACATYVGLSWDPIQTCFSGDQGTSMLKQAQSTFAAAGIGMLPYVFVNGKYAAPDYDDVKKAICASNPNADQCK